jgi:hypothetical protein
VVVLRQVAEAEVEQAVRDYPGPLLWLSAPASVQVDVTEAGHHGPAVRRAAAGIVVVAVAVAGIPDGLMRQRREQRVPSNQVQSGPPLLRRRVRARGLPTGPAWRHD